MSEPISEIYVSPDHAGRFKQTIKRLANGEMDENELLVSLRGRSQEYVKRLIDEMNGEACLLCIGMKGVSQDNIMANRLFNAVETLEAELQGVGYRDSAVGGGGNPPTDFPQEKTPRERLPEELSTEKAMQYWRKAVKVGFVDENFNLSNTVTMDSKTIQITDFIIANFCFTFSTKLGLKYKYSYFKKLWGKKYLSQARQRADELGYYVGDEIIKDIFND